MSYTNGLDKPSDYFNTVLYSGNSTTGHAITGVGFKPDWVWIKARNVAEEHHVFDVVRGASTNLNTNNTSVDSSSIPLSSFDSDGFTLGSANSAINGSTYTYASWNWLAGGTASSNTDGSITSSVSVNTTAGFSIVSYSGGGTQDLTVGHGLGTTPDMIIVKNRSIVEVWRVWHSSLSGSTYKLALNKTDAENSSSTVFNGQSSTTFTVGTDPSVNGSGNNIIAYCFNSVKGYSKFGSYTGNGNADGTFVYTGFKPAWVMIKSSTTVEGWIIFDNKRNGFNVQNRRLMANTSGTEGTSDDMDILSNGFKIRDTGGVYNTSGASYIYMCFAESPFTTSTGIPTTAR